MSRRASVLLLVATLLWTFPIAAQTLDEVLAKNLETRGGSDAFDAVGSALITGTMDMESESVPVALEVKRPDKRRMAIEIQGSWITQAFDGERGWKLVPFFGSADPSILPEDQVRQFLRDTDLVDGPLVRTAEKGYTVELEGEERIEGTDAYKLRVTSADGSVFHSYLDTEHCLEFKRRGTASVRGREMRFEVTLGNYKKVGGIYVPHLIQTSLQGRPQSEALRIESVELNVELEDGRFSPPQGAGEEGGR